ncbi:hypothetical protein Tco_0074012 [Tanacetum coccineum]
MIPLSRGSFDVLVGMDRLSKRKFGIVCHEKVVRIPLEGDEILRVHGERAQGVVKTLMNTKSCKTKVSYDLVLFRREHQCRLLRRGAWSSFEVSVRITEEGEVVLWTRYWLLKVRRPSMSMKFTTILVRQNVVIDALRRKEQVKPRRVRAMAMTIQYGVRGMILAAQSEAFKRENGMMRMVVMDEAHASRFRWMIYLVVLADAAESVSDTIGFEYCLASSSGWTKVEVGDRVLLKVTPWKGVVHFGKKSKLAPRYVGSFGILERIGLVSYRLRLPEELSSVHDIFHVSNLKKCLADANLHVPLNEIKIDKTLRFVEEPIEIMDRGIRSSKRSKISLVKVCCNSKHGPEFTWEREDHMKFKYPRLFVDRSVESAS